MMRWRHTSRGLPICIIAILGIAPILGAEEVSRTLSCVLSESLASPKTAQAEVEYARAILSARRAQELPDISVTLSPLAKIQGDDDTRDPQKARITSSMSVSLPFSMTPEQNLRAEAASDRVSLERLRLEESRQEELLRLINLYHGAYLAQQEIQVASMERELARIRLDIEQSRFERGEIRFIDFERVSTSYVEAQASFIKAEGMHHDRVRALAAASGIRAEDLLLLQPPPLVHPENTGVIDTLAGDNPGRVDTGAVSWRIASQRAELQAIEREVHHLPSLARFAQARIGFDYQDHSASISLNPVSRILSLGYTPAGITLVDDGPSRGGGSSSGGDSSDFDWNLNLSVSFSVSLPRISSYDREIAELSAESARLRLLELELEALDRERESVNDLRQALDDQKNSEIALARAKLNHEIVEVQAEAGRSIAADVMAAGVALERATLNLQRAQLQTDRILLSLVPSLGTHLHNTLEGRIEG